LSLSCTIIKHEADGWLTAKNRERAGIRHPVFSFNFFEVKHARNNFVGRCGILYDKY